MKDNIHLFEFFRYWNEHYSDLDLKEGTPEFSAALMYLEEGKSIEHTAQAVAVRFWQAHTPRI